MAALAVRHRCRIMRRKTIASIATLALGGVFSTAAHAVCPSFHTLANGTTADATKVMDNFNYVLCSPGFTGPIGVGTSSPAFSLDVVGEIKTRLQAAGNATGITIGDNGSERPRIIFGASDNSPRFKIELSSPNTTTERLSVYAGPLGQGANQETMVVGGDGNIGVGTTDPGGMINTAGYFRPVANGRHVDVLSNTYEAVLNLRSNQNTNDGYIGGVYFTRDSGQSDAHRHIAAIQARQQGTGGTAGGALYFFTKNNGGGVNDNNPRLTIRDNGNVGIGLMAPGYALDVNGQVRVGSFASASATAVCHNSNVLSACSSSARYKEEISDGAFGLNDVLNLRPVTFKWKGRDEADLGFIAEEVEKVNPLFITYKDGQIEGVKYAQLTAALANAVKELHKANQTLTTEVAALRQEVGDLRSREAGTANTLFSRVAQLVGW